MKLVRNFLLLVVAGILISCAIAPVSLACSTPPTLTITYSWPPHASVSVVPNNVPNGPVSTAFSNWNAAMFYLCSPATLGLGTSGSIPPLINMNYAYIPPPASCPAGQTCYTRGITDLPHAGITNGRLSTVNMTINSAVTDAAAITEVVAHEFGHTFALYDCNYPGCPTGSSVMEAGAPTSSINGLIGQPGPTACDITAVLSVAPDYNNCPPPPPPPPPDPCCRCRYSSTKGKQQQNVKVLKTRSMCCTCDCPIIIDTSGNGFELTSASNGVSFDMSGTASPVQMSWTAPGANNAFLCLPDTNGMCDDGKDLFGNFTPQPPSQTPNGFLALAVYDLPVNGGNGDGIIDSNDAIFSRLRLWIDSNHDGISQPDEIYTLPSLGVYSISLAYKEDRRTDQYGNLFRYRAQVNPGGPPGSVGRMVYDVFLLLGSNTITAQSCPAANPQGKQGALTNNRR
jgi:hypothetical protein